MMMMKSSEGETDSRAKRQRMSPTPAATVHNLLSADLWCDVADFLPKTSRAFLAVALTAPPASFRESGWKGQPNTVSKAIISSIKNGEDCVWRLMEELRFDAGGEIGADGLRRQLRSDVFGFCVLLWRQLRQYYKDSTWATMDFIDIPQSLACRLTDDDVGAVLVCIDAKSKLERLTLTHCFNVVGHGLKPLEASTVLQELNVGLYRDFETPFWSSNPSNSIDRSSVHSFREIKLSEGPVCDILDSVLRRKGASFRRLHYPFEWYLKSRLGCDGNLAGIASLDIDRLMRSRRMKEFVEGSRYNATLNLFSCCVYFNYGERHELCSYLHTTRSNQNELGRTDQCMKCNQLSFAVCSHCDEILCKHCAEAKECYTCKDVYCLRCENNGFSDVAYCNDDECEINQWLCKGCRLEDCRENHNNCSGCTAMAFETLLDEMGAKQEELDRSKSVMFTSTYPPITLRFKDGWEESLVTIERNTTMETLLQAYADKFFKRDAGDCHLTFRGEIIQSSDTPESMGFHGMEEIEVVRR